MSENMSEPTQAESTWDSFVRAESLPDAPKQTVEPPKETETETVDSSAPDQPHQTELKKEVQVETAAE